MHYENFGLEYIFDVIEFFVKRLDDLLNVCDYLACQHRDNAIRFAEDYRERNILFRAAYIYRRYSNLHPNDLEMKKRYTSVLLQQQKWEDAIRSLDEIVLQDPGDAPSFNELGKALIRFGKPEDAVMKFEIALSIIPDFEEAQNNLTRCMELLQMIAEANMPNKLPPLRVNAFEREDSALSPEKVELAHKLFTQYGALACEHVFDTELLGAIKKLVLKKYQSYFEPRDYDGCLRLGDRRHMVTLDIEGPVASPDLYDNPYIRDVVGKVLGKDYILGAVNIGVPCLARPTNRSTRITRPCSPESDEFRDNTPCFALAVLIPLVQHTHEVGTTLVIKESQKISHRDTDHMPFQAPLLKVGGALMIDYRVGHQGLANSSDDVVRPLLTLIFHRCWFRDCVNYPKQLPIKIDDQVFANSPERLKELISWAQTESVIQTINYT